MNNYLVGLITGLYLGIIGLILFNHLSSDNVSLFLGLGALVIIVLNIFNCIFYK